VTRRVVLLRHGRTAWNAEHRFQGQADPPLDDVGRTQAWEAAGIVAAMRPDLLVSSTATRALQTARMVAEATGLPVTTDARLIERGFGNWEGLTADEVAVRYPEDYALWAAGQDITRPGGETRDQVALRARAALEVLPEVPLTVIVSHGATSMALTNDLLGLAQARHLLQPLANCHWTELFQEARGGPETAHWRLRGHNLGAPGAVVPLPVSVADQGDSPDADA
jgi:broad specificity phosphatase PhoE